MKNLSTNSKSLVQIISENGSARKKSRDWFCTSGAEGITMSIFPEPMIQKEFAHFLSP